MKNRKINSRKLKAWPAFKNERFKKSPNEAIEYLKASLEDTTQICQKS